jgi:cytochrome c-type biogenesis protein CcmH/NrfF
MHTVLRWVLPLVLVIGIAIVWFDHRRRAAATHHDHHHEVHDPGGHAKLASILAIVLIVSFICSFLIP